MKKKEFVHHRNNLLPYYPKENALRELTQLYSFTGLKVIPNSSEQNQSQNTDTQVIPKQLDKKEKELSKQISKNADNKKKPEIEKKTENSKRKKIIPQDQTEKSPHRQLSRLRN